MKKIIILILCLRVLIVVSAQNTINDPQFNNQWGLNNIGQNNGLNNIDIDAIEAWEITKGAGVRVAIISSGIHKNHPDLIGCFAPESWDGDDTSSIINTSMVHSEEGTAIAGIIAGQHNNIGIRGIAPDCKLIDLSYRLRNYSLNYRWNLNQSVGPTNPFGNVTTLFEKAVEYGADVINFSDGDPYGNGVGNQVPFSIWGNIPFAESAILNAAKNGRNGLGCVIVSNSGDASGSALTYPGILPEVIAVGAIDRCGYRVGTTAAGTQFNNICNPWNTSSTFPVPSGGYSNYGEKLLVVAPGSDVYSTYGSSSYDGDIDGTGFATAYVSGVAALIISILPCASAAEVADIISKTAKKIRPNLYFQNSGFNNQVGYGLVDANAAVREAKRIKDAYEKNLIQNLTILDQKNVVSKTFIKVGQFVDPSNAPIPVVIDSSGDLKLKASNSIEIKEGFHAKHGSLFNAKVKLYTGVGCYNYAIANKKHKNEEIKLKVDSISSFRNKCTPIVYPNPLKEEIFIKTQFPINSRVDIKISNLLGQSLYEKTFQQSTFESFEMIKNNFIDEVLIIKIQCNNEIYSEKLINNNTY